MQLVVLAFVRGNLWGDVTDRGPTAAKLANDSNFIMYATMNFAINIQQPCINE